MKTLKIEKVTLNIGVGEAGDKINNAKTILERITGQKPIETKGKKRIPSWNVRIGIPIGVKVTVRGKKAEELLKKLFDAKEKVIYERQFDNNGNFAFGLRSYIDIANMEYDPTIGVFGMDVCVSVVKKGYRVKERKLNVSKIGSSHKVKKDEAVEFVKEKFGVTIK